MHLSTVKILINFGTWLVLTFTFIFNLEIYVSTKFICALFVLYLVRPSLVYINETIAGDWLNQLGLLTKHEPCYTHAERATQSSLLDALTVPPTHYVPKIVFTCTNSIAIDDHHERLDYFSASATSNPPFLLVGCDSWRLRNDLSIPQPLENMSHETYHKFFFPHLDVI